MSKLVIRVAVMAMMAALVGACQTTETTLNQTTDWPSNIRELQIGDGSSNSQVKIPPIKDQKIDQSKAGVPENLVKFLGHWKGWAGQDKEYDTGLTVFKVFPDSARVFYAIASAAISPRNVAATAAYKNNELFLTWGNGDKSFYRLRNDTTMEFLYVANNGVKVWGVLGKL